MVNNFTSGMWNGMKVEFGKVYSNLNAFVNNCGEKQKKPKAGRLLTRTLLPSKTA